MDCALVWVGIIYLPGRFLGFGLAVFWVCWVLFRDLLFVFSMVV